MTATLPTTMRAAVITRAGGPEVLDVQERPVPAPGTGQLLVRVRASALNRADLLQRRGGYAAPAGSPSDIPGIEFSGEVAALGPGAREWRVGDRVFGLVGGGAHAEYVTVHERTVAAVPSALSWGDAAAVPEAFITAHDALRQADARPGDHVLVHAVGSGVGLAAVQLIRAFAMTPYGTARTAAKVERARAFGLADGLVPDAELRLIAERAREWTGGRGVDVVLDLAGGPYVAASLDALAPRGRLVLVGLVAGARADIDLGRLLRQRITMLGTVMRARPLEERIGTTRAFAAEVVPLLAAGTVRPVIDSFFSLDDLARAHERLESNATFGKVVIEIA